MGQKLYQQWLEEEVEDPARVIWETGINGLLSEFETWLEDKGHILVGEKEEPLPP